MIAFLSRAVAQAPAAGIAATPPDLNSIEENIAKKFNDLRQKRGLKPLAFRKDIRLRMEACSTAFSKPAYYIDAPTIHRRLWYSTQAPTVDYSELERISYIETQRDHFGVGAWFLIDDKHPHGTYWIIVYPEHSASSEWLRRRFYLTDDFEYVTPFDKSWRRRLPQQCQQIK